MKSDIDRLLDERNLDALVVLTEDGAVSSNMPFAYMTGGVELFGTVIKRRGHAPVLLYSPMEEQQAASTGLEMIPYNRWDSHAIFERFPGDREAGMAELVHQWLSHLGIHGRVAFTGLVDVGSHFALLQALARYDDVEPVGEFEDSVISVARITKDAAKVEAIRRTSRLTTEVITAAVAFMQSHRVAGDGSLQSENGTPLTIGDVKQFVNGELRVRELDAPEGFIFAAGSDAGLPHSEGRADELLRLGVPIVFDIYPRARSGYFTDVTRTFCLGHAPEPVQEAYDQVMEIFRQVMADLKAGEPVARYQEQVCRYFAARGHATVLENRATTTGYIHSLGHGVGLAVHEQPYLGISPGRDDRLQPGSVIAVEPGLYYPERGFGIRIEDTVYLDETGIAQRLTDYPYDLIVPVH